MSPSQWLQLETDTTGLKQKKHNKYMRTFMQAFHAWLVKYFYIYINAPKCMCPSFALKIYHACSIYSLYSILGFHFDGVPYQIGKTLFGGSVDLALYRCFHLVYETFLQQTPANRGYSTRD